MGCQEYLINHTQKVVYRIDNSGHHSIFREVALALKNNPTWSADDDVELFMVDVGDMDVMTYGCYEHMDVMTDLLMVERYACNDPSMFLDGNDLRAYLEFIR